MLNLTGTRGSSWPIRLYGEKGLIMDFIDMIVEEARVEKHVMAMSICKLWAKRKRVPVEWRKPFYPVTAKRTADGLRILRGADELCNKGR